MKKITIAFSVAAFLVSAGAAFAADDAAALFKTHCQGCHGTDGGRSPGNGVTPIKGQDSAELLKMLEGYKDDSFGGPQKRVMQGVAKRLSDEQMKSLADYVSKL